MAPDDYLSNMKPAIDAAAEGELRCAVCGIALTIVDPFTDRVVKVTEFEMVMIGNWQGTENRPHAWCTTCG